jgi:hypothetical protein
MTWRDTALHAARVQVLVNASWLLAPLFVRDAGPTDPANWSRWWSAAVDFRPGGPAPRQEELVAFSPALSKRWQESRTAFDRWLASQPADLPPPVEQQRLNSFARRTGALPAPRTLTVLVVPFGDELFLRPERDRLVVDAGLRAAEVRYLRLLDPVLADFF